MLKYASFHDRYGGLMLKDKYKTAACLLFVVLLAISGSVAQGQENQEPQLMAGAAALDITPQLGVSLAGSMRPRFAEHIHDGLAARSLVLDNGEMRLAFVVCDLMAVSKETVDRAKALIFKTSQIPPERVLIAATHTHTAPVTVHVFQSDPDQAYLEDLPVRIADSVSCAINNLCPARIGWGKGREERVVFNRRFYMKEGSMPSNPWGRNDDGVKTNPGYENPNIIKPAGPTDPELPILSVQHTNGMPIAVLGNYTLHYVGGGPGSDVSADYFGMWGKMIQRDYAGPADLFEPPFVSILTNGCSGDINNIDVRTQLKQPYRYHQMHNVARMVADESLRVLKEIEYRPWIPLSAQLSEVKVGIRKPSADELDEAKQILASAEAPFAALPAIYAHETVRLDAWPDTLDVPVQAFAIGDTGFVGFPGEAFVELGLEVKEKSPFAVTFCIDLANAYAGYIPTPDAFELSGYETWRARSSPLAHDSAPRIVAKALELIKEVHAGVSQ